MFAENAWADRKDRRPHSGSRGRNKNDRRVRKAWIYCARLNKPPLAQTNIMFSHVVIFWTRPEIPGATEALLAGAEKYLRPIPGVRSFHIGRMVPSHRDVVDQSYQVALNLQFDTKQAQ